MKKQSSAIKIERRGVSQDERDELLLAFQQSDINGTERITPKEIKSGMESLGLDVKHPHLFAAVCTLATVQRQKGDDIDFDSFIDKINQALLDQEDFEGIRRLFDLFVDDPVAQTISVFSLRKVAKELGDNRSDEELTAFLQKHAANHTVLTYDEWHAAMIETPDWLNAIKKAAL